MTECADQMSERGSQITENDSRDSGNDDATSNGEWQISDDDEVSAGSQISEEDSKSSVSDSLISGDSDQDDNSPGSEIESQASESCKSPNGYRRKITEPAESMQKTPKPQVLTHSPIRRRLHASKATLKTALDDTEEERQPVTVQLKSQLSEVAHDVWSLVRAFFTLQRVSYPVWKWLLLVYLLCLVGSNILVTSYQHACEKLSPLQQIPYVREYVPLCAPSPIPTDSSISVGQLVAYQDELAGVAKVVGRNDDLAQELVDHEFPIRDLRIRVEYSELKRKAEIYKLLSELLLKTRQTVR